MAEAPPTRRRRPSRKPSPLDRLGRRIDRGLKAIEAWTKRLNAIAAFLTALGALALALGAFGLTQCTGPGGPTPTPARVTDAPSTGGAGSATPEASATPTPTPQPSVVRPANYRLRWVESPTGGSVLDGNILSPGSEIWLEEVYPETAPTAFEVEAVIDPALDAGLEDEITGPGVEVRAENYVAYSDRSWTLPAPPPSTGSISYRFRDDAGRRSGAVTVAALATIAVRLESTDGGLPGLSMGLEDELRIEFDVAFADAAVVDVQLLVPWDDGPTGLDEFVRAYYGEVTRDPEAAEAATGRFLETYAGTMPGAQPEGWAFGAEPGELLGTEGGRQRFAITGQAPTAGSSLLAVRLVDREDPSRVAVSPIFRLEAVGPNEAPRIEILEPAGFTEGTSFVLDSAQGDGYFVELQLQANVTDADGPIADDAIVWTTDRADLQPNGAVLGTGEFLITRLYAADCTGARHVVTITAEDPTGQRATLSGDVSLNCLD